MPRRILVASTCCFLAGALPIARAQSGATAPPQDQAATAATVADPIKAMVERLDLEKYKATIKGLTQFGDRRQGTDRNRAAIDWIEAQLKSYGCTNTERIRYDYHAARTAWRAAAAPPRRGSAPRPDGAGWRPAARDRGPHRRQQRPQPSARREAARAEHRSRPPPGRAKRSTARRSAPRTPTRCTSSAPTWTARLGRSRQRRRLGHRARDGAGAHFQQPGRADRALDPLHPVEQRGNRAQRRARLRRAAPGAAGQGRACRVRQVSRAALARHDPARHDDVRPRHAARRRHDQPRSSGPRRTSTSSSRSTRRWRRRPQALAWTFHARQREVRHRLSGRGRQPHDEHRLDAVQGSRRRRSACARTSAARRSAAAGTRTGTSRPTCTPPSATRTSGSASTRRRRRSGRSRS